MSYRKFSANKLTTQIFCKKSTRRSSLERSRDINFPVMPWGLHVTQFVTSLDVLEASLWKHVWVFLYRSFLSFRRSLSGTMDPNLLRECAQRLLETADFIRNRTAAVTSQRRQPQQQPQAWQPRNLNQTAQLLGVSTTDCLATGRQLRNELLEILVQIVGEHTARPIQTQRRSYELHVEQVVRMYGDSRTANATVNLREDWPVTERPGGRSYRSPKKETQQRFTKPYLRPFRRWGKVTKFFVRGKGGPNNCFLFRCPRMASAWAICKQ